MGFSRQEYWSGLPFPSPGDLPDPRMEPGFPALEADALTSEPPGKPIHLLISSKSQGRVKCFILSFDVKLNAISENNLSSEEKMQY